MVDTRSRYRNRREPHRVWAALEHYDVARDRQSHETHPVLPREPGVVHAYGERANGAKDPEFFTAKGPYALCGSHVKVRLAVLFREGEDDACSKCVELVRVGVTSRRSGYLSDSRECQSVIQPVLPDAPPVAACARRADHDGPHRASDGAEWNAGPEDYVPARWSSH